MRWIEYAVVRPTGRWYRPGSVFSTTPRFTRQYLEHVGRLGRYPVWSWVCPRRVRWEHAKIQMRWRLAHPLPRPMLPL